VQGAPATPDADLARQREVVDAFFAAARRGDFDALVALLDPDVVVRSDGGPKLPALSTVVRGAEQVASRAMMFARPDAELRRALVNGAAGVVVYAEGRPFTVMGFTVVDGTIRAIETLADPERIERLGLDN
jgi:ketosteroid isomerase-like protein